MALPVPLLKVRCNHCSKFKPTWEVQRLPGGVIRCFQCVEHHQEAILSIARAQPPKACHGCNVPFRDLKDIGDGNVPMALVEKDGIYQILCLPCEGKYVRKRQDLFRGTRFGWTEKLDGAK